MAYDPTTETVVLFGGSLGSTNSDETWKWDGVTWTQQFPPVSPSARGWNINGMVFDSLIGKVVLFGGYTVSFGMFNDTWEWDGTSKTWTEQFPATSPSPRQATLAYDETSKQVVLFGGLTGQWSYAGDTWTYNGVDWVQHVPSTVPPPPCDNALWSGTEWTQVQTSPSPSVRSGASFDYDATVKGMLVFGGWVGPSSFTSTNWLLEVSAASAGAGLR
jgi:hypothetical protein